MTPSEAPKALQPAECSEQLDPMRANCWISAQHWPGKFVCLNASVIFVKNFYKTICCKAPCQPDFRARNSAVPDFSARHSEDSCEPQEQARIATFAGQPENRSFLQVYASLRSGRAPTTNSFQCSQTKQSFISMLIRAQVITAKRKRRQQAEQN